MPGFDDDPAFSPDGRTIAYVHAGGTVKSDELEHSDVFLMRADGTAIRSITHFAAYSGDSVGIAGSPDGRRLLVGRYDAVASRTALFVMNADATHSRQLTAWKLGASGAPDWSARGDLIAFRVADEDSGIANFFTIRADGTGLRQATHSADRKSASRSPSPPMAPG